jgi:hypothetical protein
LETLHIQLERPELRAVKTRSYSSFNKQSVLSNGSSSTPDVEARAIAEKNNIRIVDYVEDMPK